MKSKKNIINEKHGAKGIKPAMLTLFVEEIEVLMQEYSNEQNKEFIDAFKQIIKYCSVLPKQIAVDDKNQLALYNIYHTAKQLIKK